MSRPPGDIPEEWLMNIMKSPVPWDNTIPCT
jgi:hypothetical protein